MWDIEFQPKKKKKKKNDVKCRKHQNRCTIASGWLLNSYFLWFFIIFNGKSLMHPIIEGGGNSIWDRPYHKTLLQINYNKRMVETTPPRCQIDDLKILNEGNLQW